jgi:hypothetical protein
MGALWYYVLLCTLCVDVRVESARFGCKAGLERVRKGTRGGCATAVAAAADMLVLILQCEADATWMLLQQLQTPCRALCPHRC